MDPLVSAFWETLFCDVEWLIRQVETVEEPLTDLDFWTGAMVAAVARVLEA